MPNRATTAPKSLDTSARARYVLLGLVAISLLFSSLPGVAAFIVFLLPAAFVYLHARQTLSGRDMAAIFAIFAAVSFLFEAVGTNTGLIYGSYYYTTTYNGVLLLGVPPLLTLSYIVMGYVAYLLARLLLGYHGVVSGWRRIIGLSAVAAFLMVLWDMAIDPTFSVVHSDWVWPDGGAWFGVPLQNFVGWFLCAFTLMLLVTCYLAWRQTAPRVNRPQYGEVIAYYAITAASMVVPLVVWQDISDISQAAAIVAVYGMGLPVLVAIARLRTEQLPK